jgi:uncharacterized damage-inducible protein DinB
MSDKQCARFLFDRARRGLLGLIEDLPADKWCWQPFKDANHVTWSVGHIATVDNLAIEVLTGAKPSPLPPHAELFGPGSKPLADPAKYPTRDEVLAYAKAQRERLLAALDAASDESLTREMPSQWKSIWPDVRSMLLSLAWHEGFHVGQIAAVRKALGLKPKFM